MARKKQKVRTSWAGQFANESLNLKNISDINAGTSSIEDEITSSIDRTNRIEEDIERMRKERRALEEDPEGYLDRNSVVYSPELGDYNDVINATVEEFNNTNMPKVSSYTKNAWAYHGRKMNDFQIGDFQGYIDRTKHWQDLSKGVIRSWEIEDRVNQINKEIEQLQSARMSNEFDVLNVNQKIEDLLHEQEILVREHDELKDIRNAFDSYIPSGLKSRYYDLVSGNASKGGLANIFSNNRIFGRTSQLHDEMGDFLRFTSQMYTPGITRERLKLILQTALDASNNKIEEWQNGIDLNIKDREKYDKVDEYYKLKFDKGGTDFFSLDTWLYGMPGLIAGSTSGMSKILPAMLLGIATGGSATAVGAAYGALAGWTAGLAGFGATAAFNYGAGIAENNAEVAEAYSERIKDYLQNQKGAKGSLYDDVVAEGRKKLNMKNASADEVFEQFRRGSFDINNTAVNKKLTKLATGIENQFQDDMMATTYGALFESALEVVPFGKIIKIPRALKYAALRTEKGRKFMRGETINRLKEGFIVGSTANPVVGALYAPLHVLVRPTLNKAGRVGKVVIENIAEATGISKFIPELTFTRKFLNEPRKKLIKDISGRWLLSSIEEGIEEGKLHIAADKYKSGEYSSDVIKSMSETFLDDMLAGSRSAGLILGMPFESLLSESDRETLKEIKGGFLLGGLQTAVVNTASQYLPYSSEMSARDAIVNTVLADKAQKVDALNKGRIYAEASKSASAYNHIKDAFNVLREKNEQEYESTGEYAIGKDYIDEEENEFKRVAKMANDAYTIKQAEAQGIMRGTDEYDNFVAHKALAEQHVDEEIDILNTARQNYNGKNDDIQTLLLTEELRNRSALIPGEELQENSEEEGASGETLLKITNDYIRTKTVAEYTAMLKRKQELEVGIDNARRSGKKLTEKILQDQLDNLNMRIKINKPVVKKLTNAAETTSLDTIEDVERDLITDRTNHDELVDLYREVLVATDDYEIAKKQYDRIVGTAYLDGKEITEDAQFDMNNDIDRITFKNGEAKKIMKATQDTMNDDDDFMSVFLQDYLDRTDDNGEEVISPEEKEEIQEAPPQNNPEEEFKEEVMKASKKPYVKPSMEVREKPVEAILSHSEPVSAPLPTVNPETTETVSKGLKNTITTHSIDKKGNPISAEYSIEKRDGGFIWINYEIKKGSRLKARATIDGKVLQELGISFEDLYGEYIGGTLEGLDGYNKFKREVLSDGDRINTVIIRPDGSVLIRTENMEISEQAAKKVILKLMPEAAPYFESKNNIQIATNQSPSEPVSSAQPIVNSETPETPSEQPKNAVILDLQFNIDDLDFDNNYYVAHQTSSDNLLSIGQYGLNNPGGLNGTALFANKDSILSALQLMREGHGHRGSDGLVLFSFPKSMFSGRIKSLDDISIELASIVGPDALNVTPPNFIAYLIQTKLSQVNPKAPIETQSKTAPVIQELQPIISSRSQQEVIDLLKALAQLSKSRVKRVTKEYYLIQVGDELIQMPRVHSVMPKYWYGDGSYNAALLLGNVFDNLARIFFGDVANIDKYEQNKQAFIDEWFAKPVSEDLDNPNSLNKVYSLLYTSEQAFAKTIDDLYQLAKQYRDLGWQLSTDKIVWYSQFESGWVAGETDMVAVDRLGNIHIIDFKTAKGISPFETFVTDDLYRTNKYAGLLSTLTEDDFKAGPKKKALSKAAKDIKRQIRIAEGKNKNIMLVWSGDRAVIKYANSEYYTVPTRMQGFRSGPKSLEYSDQLTAYAEMIQKRLANVVDLEVVGFRTQYTADKDTNLINISLLENEVNGKPFRIKVSFSDEMKRILNNDGSPVEPVESPNIEAVEAKVEAETIQLTQQDESKKNDIIVPKKTVTAPNEPAPVMPEQLGYSNINPTLIEKDDDLAKLTTSPTFISDCLQNGSIELYTEEVTDRKGTNKYVYANITYSGKTHKRVYIWATPQLQRKIEELEKNKKPGQKIVATALRRTGGKIKPTKDGKSLPLTETSLLAGISLQDLEFTAADGRFGIINNGTLVSYEGGDTTQPRALKTGLRQPDGTIMMLKPAGYKENPTEVIPVTVARKTFKDSADFIIECLRQIDTIDQPYVTTINGKSVSTGVSKKLLLSLLMPIIQNKDLAQSYSLMRDPVNPAIFYVVVRSQQQPVAVVDLRDPRSVNSFKSFLSVTDMPLHNKILTSRIGNSSNKTMPVFKNIKLFFGRNAGINSITITPDIKFDRSDILGEGLSGLAWYIKTGRLVTNYEDVVAPLVSIGDAGYYGEKPVKIKPTEIPTIFEETGTPLNQDNDVIDLQFAELDKRLSEKDKNKPKLTVEKIKENLRPILGDEVDDPAVLNIIENIAQDPRFDNASVVGLAHADGIRIYGAAFEGVEYHEAFHRIFELFVPNTIREKIYTKVAKNLGLDLGEDSEKNKYNNHRLVAEYVADKYMDYKTNQFKTGIRILDWVLNKIRDIANAYFRLSDRLIYKIFMEVNSGKYRSEKRNKAGEAEKKRFNDIFGELNYEVHGEQFMHIVNDPMYEDAKNTAFYCIMLGQAIDVSGKHVSDTKINRQVFMRGADRLLKEGFDIFGTQVEPEDKTKGQLVMSELYSKFDTVSDDIAAMFANISTDYKKVRREETEEDLDGDEVSIASAWDENFFKWDYEFSRFDKSSSRVKYFFASIPDMEYGDNYKLIPSVNGLGMPQMLPMKYVFNEALSQLWDIDTLDELVQRLWKLAHQHPMWSIISMRVLNLLKNRNDADVEALLTLLMNTIRSNRHMFMLAKAVENQEGMYTINMQTSDADYNAREYPIQWSQILAKGGSDILKVNERGQLVFNLNNPEAAVAFKKIARMLDFSALSKDGKTLYVGLKLMLSDTPTKQKKTLILWDILGTEEYKFSEWSDAEMINAVQKPKRNFITRAVTDLSDPAQLSKVKKAICDALNTIGINIHIHEFDYMLQHKYGAADMDALRQMIDSTDESDSITSFLYFLNTISNGKTLNLDNDGNVTLKNGKKVPLENIYEKLAFVKELGNWKYQYRHSKDELTVLATGNNRFYEMSDNDLFSDTLRSLNKRGLWYEDLKADPYNYYTDSTPDANGEYRSYGSYTLDLLVKNPELKLQLRHLIGFKTDKVGDTGQDYFEISRREDYLSKVAILESGGILSLTLSDKKKYVYIQGIKLPGLDYSSVLDEDGNILPSAENAIQKTHSEQDGGIDLLDSVVSQFVSYAYAERESIRRAAESNLKVKNYSEQGTRFSSLLGVWEDTYDKDGNYVGEHFVSFNDSNKTWQDNLQTAEEHFFNLPEDEQKALIKRNLNKILDKELATAEGLGLIQKVGNNSNKYLNYKNVGLNNVVIASLTNAYMTKYPGCSQDVAQSIAVVVYLNDISNKAIMSGQEMERLMSGNPAFYKWKYNSKGELIDRTVDELKRLGGLGSTGTNNFTELTNIPDKYKNGKYRCAEVDNEEVASPQLDMLRTTMYEGELRKNIIYNRINEERNNLQALLEFDIQQVRRDKELDEVLKQSAIIELRNTFNSDLKASREHITQEVDNSSIEDLERAYKDSEVLNLSRDKATEAANSFAGKIDVADGGAYITDEMCEMLLRMEGSWSKDIEEAFDILRGRKKADYLGKSEAYQKVLTTVIGNQKYTAFGRRLEKGVSVPYYHKMALFPIFECIATGKMGNVFDKMKEQGVDMLLVNSAVKVGSEGSKPINWTDYRENDDPQNENNFFEDAENGTSWKPTFKDTFSFNTYDVDFSYLRKQLNTDPKEDEMLRMGTQALKIIFSNLFQGRMYKTLSGEEILGQDLLNRIMSTMNKMSNLGVKKLNERFFITDNDGNLLDAAGNIIEDPNSDDRLIDIEKFAKETSRLMSDRGADKNVIKALEVIANSYDGKTTSLPLGAISNASWLESVLISMINKDVVDVNTPGAFFIQRSVWAMQGQRMYSRDKGNIVGRQLYNGNRLQMINEEGSMDCVLSLDYFEHILPKVQSDEYELDENGDYKYIVDKDGKYKKDKYGNFIPKRKMREMSFDEARQWLLDNGIIGGKANIIAYRIPTLAESSIHALRCVDVLPVVRDTVILPEEFTKITGSDFDIDKLGLSTINWYVDNKNIATDKFEEGTEKLYQNLLIRDFITMLIDPNTVNILHRSIDNDTKLLTNIVEELEGKSSSIEEPYGFYSLSTQTERKNDYITGKIGIGPFALNNNNHILTMLYDVRFKNIPGTIMSTLGLTNLASQEDFEHNSVMSWISALINAHVDIAKDPYISKLNVNPYTYNLVNTLIRTGFGRNTFYFTTQPIMKELAVAYMNAASSYMANKNKSQYQLQKEAVEEIADDRFNGVELLGRDYDTWKKVFDLKDTSQLDAKEAQQQLNEMFKQLVDNKVLRKNANKPWYETVGTVVKVNNKNVELNRNQIQMIVYFANIQFAPYAQSVSSLVKYSKIDTKKHGKSYIELRLYEQGFDELFFDKEGTGLFEEDGIRRMARDSYILTKTRNAIAMTRNILKGQFLLATPAFDNAIQYVLNEIGRPLSKDVSLNDKVSKIIMAAIKSEFINQYAANLRPDNPTYIRDLVSESEETFDFSQAAGQKGVSLKSNSNYDLKSYIGGRAYITFTAAKGAMKIGQLFGGGVIVANVVDNLNDATYTLNAPITGADDEVNEIFTPITRKSDANGTIRLTKGKNTIVDRFDRLLFEIKNEPGYEDILDKSGEPINMLLRSLVHGRTFDYKAPITNIYQEMPDTYPNLKFLKLFNALDQNGTESNYIIDGWDELLHDNKHPKLKEFAEDLVVYAFVTSGDQGGFTKMFKQVPFSWRKESGYGEFIRQKIDDYESSSISTEMLRDAILNNWFDNDIVRTYYSTKMGKDGKTQIPQFITYSGESASRPVPQYNPLLLAALTINEETGVYEPSIDSNTAPRFIKVPRANYKAAKDSQRAYTVYEKIDDGMKQDLNGKWIMFPIYAKVEPKGNQLKGNYLITEYGRSDSRQSEKTPNRESLASAYKIGDFLNRQVVQDMSDKWSVGYSEIVESLNYRDMLRKFGDDMKKFLKEYTRSTEEIPDKQNPTLSTTEKLKTVDGQVLGMWKKSSSQDETPASYSGMITPSDDTIFVFGSNPEGRHGARAAKVAVQQFGAVYGQGEGLQGQSYALPTKDLRVKENNGYRSISPELITENIRKMYEVAKQHPNKKFKVAYTNGLNERTLNGYTGTEMIRMFKNAGPIPPNVYFSENWTNHWKKIESEDPTQLTPEEQKEAEDYEKMCEGE